jgi:nitrilase
VLTASIDQFAPLPDVEANLAALKDRLAPNKTKLVVLPENCLYLGDRQGPCTIARGLEEWRIDLAEVALAAGATTVFGGVPVLRNDNVMNTSIVVTPTGEVLAYYDKIHLFQLFSGDEAAVDETKTYTHGDWSPATFEVDGWKIGLTICYDLRFPELYREYAGCDAIICTAAFTRHTGRAHWELLCRVRAVENQCWLIAAGACGENRVTGHQSWGHSMIVDPWGRIVEEAGEFPEIIASALAKEAITATRAKLPALKSRRK